MKGSSAGVLGNLIAHRSYRGHVRYDQQQCKIGYAQSHRYLKKKVMSLRSSYLRG